MKRFLAERLEKSTRESRCVAELSSRALQQNYAAIRGQVPGLGILPMVKANAYGHDAVWAARELLESEDLYGFGVATLGEGEELRRELGARARNTRILVFSGVSLWTEEKGQRCERFRLTPVISTDEDWRAFFEGGWHARIAYHLKFNTGMNRLGLSLAEAPRIAKALRELPATSHPDGIASHLASGEDPDCKASLRQLDGFMNLRSTLSPALPSAQFHLGNSAAIWNSKYWRLAELTDIVRPGLSLYGVPPWKGAPERGLQTVMSLKAEVLAVQKLKAGDSVGYGGTYVAEGAESVATLGAGYADGIHRALSGRGHLWLDGAPTRFCGVVSMDLCAARAGARTRPGDWAEILGPHVDIWAQSREAGTLPYELLTSVSSRVQRIYV